MAIYKGSFESVEDVEDNFGIKLDNEYEILIAVYDGYGYEGIAYVLLQDYLGNLFEVHGSHCSCYGLEDQWDPEPTTLESIKYRLEKGNLGQLYSIDFTKDLERLLDEKA